MKNYKLLIACLLTILLFSQQAISQQSDRQFVSINKNTDKVGKVEIEVSDGKYFLEPYNSKILHVTFLPKERQLKNFSYAASMKPEASDAIVTEPSDNEILIDISGIKIGITKAPFNISYAYNDRALFSEKNGYAEADSSWMINLGITSKEILYGGGARVLGMNRRGNRLTLYNRAHYGYETRSELMNYTLPLMMSSNLYAVLFDNAGLGYLDLDSQKSNTVSYESYSGTPNYFIVAGDNWYDLISQYTLLTGRQPLPPIWTFGNFSSRFGYHTQKQTEETVDKFSKEDIPLDAVIIDIYWFGKEIKGEMGNLAWYTDSFPEPDKMIRKFKNKGIKTVLVTEPFILTTSNRWNEAVKEDILAKNKNGEPYRFDFYFGNTGLIDLYKPSAREWFWNIYKDLTLQGIDGWWGDLGEPEVHPADIIHAVGTGNDIHNAYGHEWAKLIYEGYSKDFPNVRPFILMRAGYAGSQRYGIIPWSGDVSRSWGGLVSQPEIALQMGMQGLAYMHSDLGGFAGGDSINDELYVRWLQYGIFQPVFRPHAQEHIPAEPVYQHYRTKLFAKDAIELRYSLLPYNYSLAFENSRTGHPLMRPLFFLETDNSSLLTYDSCYMWGDAFLVAPVKKPGEIYQEVYLPKDYNWTDFFTNQVYKGGRFLKYPLTMNNIPVFVKSGSFVPMTPGLKNTSAYTITDFEMHYYADIDGSNNEYTLYHDDGITPSAAERGLSQSVIFKATEEKEGLLEISMEKVTDNEAYSKEKDKVKFCVHNLEMRPASVTINGIKIKDKDVMWNPVNNVLKFDVVCDMTKKEIVIKK